MVTYRKNPNKKKGENFYEVAFPKKVSARPLTDEEIEYFMTLKPLSEVINRYGMRDFERALEGLQNFDTENEIDLFEDEDWLEHLEEIRLSMTLKRILKIQNLLRNQLRKLLRK